MAAGAGVKQEAGEEAKGPGWEVQAQGGQDGDSVWDDCNQLGGRPMKPQIGKLALGKKPLCLENVAPRTGRILTI